MIRTLFLLLTFGCLTMPACQRGQGTAPGAILRDDHYDYGSWNAYSTAEAANIHLVLVRPGNGIPIIWLKDQLIDINTDRREDILKKCPTDASSEEAAAYFSPNRVLHPMTIYFNTDGTVDRVSLKASAEISVDRDSEKLTLPCSRADLVRVFGKPNKFIKAQ